ncbi:MAG: phosphate ABC transporter permease subunit PstC [Rickettsiales bacterium]|nr:phosphate ABC transporter permease subunit PstC [Rickettsiales bacterium]
MNFLIFFLILVVALTFALNRNIKGLRSEAQKQSGKKMRFASLPIHYIYCFVLWSVIFATTIILTSFSNFTKYFLLAAFLTGNFFLIRFFYTKNFNSKKHIEKAGTLVLSITAGIGILITVIITASILFESLRFFEMINPFDFLFGTTWNPQTATTSEQSVGQSAFGIVPVFLGTLLITLIAMAVAVPVGIMAAVYLCLYAKSKTRDYLKPILEILAGVPTVVYGYFAVITVAPFFKTAFASIGLNIASESALAAGFVMGVMIIPFVLSLTDDALNTVPQALKDGALALGSTKSEMIKKVVLPSAMPSIVGAIILAVSRAIGETMIVVMAAGLVAKLTFNPLDSVTTATAQIVTLLVGDQEFNSPKTLAAFALALTLFVFTFIFNIVALVVIKNYKKKYG